MKLIHRKIDFDADRDYILERHCRINYECETAEERKKSYADYRKEWFATQSEIDEFLRGLQKSMKDNRTIAEIIATDGGANAAYFWMAFIEHKESGFCYAELLDIYVEEEYRSKGIAVELIKYAETKAKENGAKSMRSGTGFENSKSVKLHEKMGYSQYRIEYEKIL